MQSQAPVQRNDTWVYQGSLLLREVAFCTCGGRLGLATGTGRDKTARRYYLCNRRKKLGKYECSAQRVNEEILDEIVVEALKETVLDEQRLGQVLQAWTEKEAIQHAKRIEAGAAVQAKADSADRALQSLLRLAKADDDLAADRLFLKELSLARMAAVQARNELAAVAGQNSGPGEVTPEQVAIFAKMMKGILDGDDKERTKLYLRTIIGRVEVGATEIGIFGNQEVLCNLITSGDSDVETESQDDDSEVRISMHDWRSRQDSNLRPSA